MEILGVRHKGLKRLIESDDARGVASTIAPRVRNILAAIISAKSIDDLHGPPGWRLHRLTGDRAGTWSLSASGNWRITFDVEGDAVSNLDLEDDH